MGQGRRTCSRGTAVSRHDHPALAELFDKRGSVQAKELRGLIFILPGALEGLVNKAVLYPEKGLGQITPLWRQDGILDKIVR
ncbi:MAG: hypothetical protein A2428_02935 [Bdellovibrionales bacterium RIFOXYC1_FULL_54_43]|nr:MAG: hypothetical protein A2428_02935 [Bdellovibrionales bacterium RIFOXYC1_FULL_54_43]